MIIGYSTAISSAFEMKSFFILVLFFRTTLYVVEANSPTTCSRCQNTNTCQPPACVCCSDDMPLTYQEIPQMVFFTFDDAITPQVAGFYRQLFDSSRRNPNGCPVSMTLFVSHSNTVYSLVREFYQKGMEIASHSVSHEHPQAATFKDEANKQKQNLARMARIPHTRIKGWRSPFLEPLGDAQPNMLQELGYAYDATLTISKKSLDEKPPVPFTLDYGWPYDCKIKPCPKQRHKGFWEVPVISLMDYLQKFDCVYVDGCNNPPPDEEAAFRFLWDNFQSYYKTNKAPFGVNMHASWFFYPDRLKAMDRFIMELVNLNDVYIISVKQVIDWLRNPVRLQDIRDFEPWGCNNANTSSGTNSAFDLRNKQIEERLKELRRERFEKQELEFLQQHRTWEMQQAAKKAEKYSSLYNTGPINGPPINSYVEQSRSNNGPSHTSSAMTWQQMLMAHTRKQHANSIQQAGQSHIELVITPRLNTQPQFPNNRMVRPVNSDQKQIMLQEQKRIREQQRIAAENRQKEEAKRLEVPSEVTDVNAKMNKEPIMVSNYVRPVHHNPVNNNQMSSGILTPHKPAVALQKTVQHIPVQTAEKTIQPPTVPILERTVLNIPVPTSPNTARDLPVDISQNPVLHATIEKPVQRHRILPTTLQLSEIVETRKQIINETHIPVQNTIVNSMKTSSDLLDLNGNRTAQKSKIIQDKTPTIKLIGGSWNLFNMSDAQMKLPWQHWIIADTTEKKSNLAKTKVTTDSLDRIKQATDLHDVRKAEQSAAVQKTEQTKQSNILFTTKPPQKTTMTEPTNQSNILFATKPPQKTTMTEPTKQSNILFATKPPQKTTTQIFHRIIPSSNYKTDEKPPNLELAVKQDIQFEQNSHILTNMTVNECRQDVNCLLPNCFCITNANPFKMKTNEIPQIVYVTIEGQINFLSYSKMRSLFNAQRINPNGCPIGSTFFVSEEGTSFSLARNLQRYGTEIAMNGLKNREYTDIESQKSDLEIQMKNIEKMIGDTGNKMKGWRTPNLKVLGNDHFRLFENKSVYDSSIVLDRSMKTWPFTLDFGLDKYCSDKKSCHFNKHPGIWEIPVTPLFGYNQSEPCNYADSCSLQPKSSEDTYDYLMKNFEKYYLGNRAPFGLHLTQKWFHWSYNMNLAGLSKFIDKMSEYNDVYMISVSDMLSWMKQPTTILNVKKSEIWNC